jgi:hypothetical protein
MVLVALVNARRQELEARTVAGDQPEASQAGPLLVPWRPLFWRYVQLHLQAPDLAAVLKERAAAAGGDNAGDDTRPGAAGGDAAGPWLGTAVALRHRRALVALVCARISAACCVGWHVGRRRHRAPHAKLSSRWAWRLLAD